LTPHLPQGLGLDRYQGRAYLSLVAFDFLETRVLGVPWPGFRNFPEINLRFYVTDEERRGVVFIREFVPQPFVAWMARTLYNEPYQAAPMESRVQELDDTIVVEHLLTAGGMEQRLKVTARNTAELPLLDSAAHHFKEHQWGFGQSRKGQTSVYEVRHPHWKVYPVLNTELDWDWARVYGKKWDFLNGREPDSVFLAQGSEISVHPNKAMPPRPL
jgi:uncharacterized protein YqjF (DUF2071 family)